MDYKSIRDKIILGTKKHLVDSTALIASSHPLFAIYETQVAGMSDEVSFNARLTITILTYAGLGYLVGRGRDISRKILKISDNTKEGLQHLHDSLYLAAINIPLSLGVYSFAGETNFKKIAIGTGMGMLYGFILGGWTGYSIDAYRDLTGIKENKRKSYPKVLKDRSPKVKKMLMAGLTSLSIAATLGIYAATPDDKPIIKEPAAIIRRLNIEEYNTIDNLLTA